MSVSAKRGTLGAVLLAISGIANAQTVATIDGVAVSQEEFDAFAIGRTGALPTEQNRSQLIDDISNLIILANAATAQKLEEQSAVRYSIEFSRRSALAQATINHYLETNPITDEAVKAEFDRQIGGVSAPEQFKARHILLETEDAANAVIGELKSGADFAELAKEKSTGPSGPQGGDLGWFDASAMVAPFSAAVAAMENGTFSQTPVQTQFGWHVILREDSRKTELPSFDDVKDRLRDSMAQQAFQAYLQGLKSAAEITTAE